MDSDDDVHFFHQFFVNVMVGSSGEMMSQPSAFSDVIGPDSAALIQAKQDRR